MENLSLSPSKYLLLGSSPNLSGFSSRRFFALPIPSRTRREGPPKTRNCVSALGQGSLDSSPRRIPKNVLEKLGVEAFASISSTSSETSSVGVNPLPSVPSSPSSIGSPLFWIGVGVGLSALFSWVATYLKKYAMQQAFKTLMGQMSTENQQFSNIAFSPGSPFPFPTPTASAPAASPSPAPSQAAVTVDVPATKVEAVQEKEVKVDPEVPKDPKKYAFVDVSPDEMLQKSPFESSKESAGTSFSKDVQSAEEVSQNGAATKQGMGASSEQSKSTQQPGSVLSVEALEKMMEDPMVQKMVYPHLPEEMRNPTTFKWMLQNPQYRQQLQEML
ncbi:hypothetical protein NE237_018851 [Protea cynaroides]|uniref:STI1 domain-containing protein n=1 Tax=Protea cynaroides TaxID=273540 RepID=A0A9Q0QPD4_9MAGN|nr:hypothetical protein NE237_018851 [Protea cynaroides]